MKLDDIAKRNQALFEDAFIAHVEENMDSYLTDDYDVLPVDESTDAVQAGYDAVYGNLPEEEQSFIDDHDYESELTDKLYALTDFSTKRFRYLYNDLRDHAKETKSYNQDVLGHVGMRQSDFLR